MVFFNVVCEITHVFGLRKEMNLITVIFCVTADGILGLCKVVPSGSSAPSMRWKMTVVMDVVNWMFDDICQVQGRESVFSSLMNCEQFRR